MIVLFIQLLAHSFIIIILIFNVSVFQALKFGHITGLPDESEFVIYGAACTVSASNPFIAYFHELHKLIYEILFCFIFRHLFFTYMSCIYLFTLFY